MHASNSCLGKLYRGKLSFAQLWRLHQPIASLPKKIETEIYFFRLNPIRSEFSEFHFFQPPINFSWWYFFFNREPRFEL